MTRVGGAWRSVALLVLTLSGCGGPTPLPSEPPTTTLVAAVGPTTVAQVVDGDTVKLSDGRTVRILGIDTPETVKPNAPVDCYGPEASAFARATLFGQTVTVTGDPTQDATDRYGRTLAYLNLPDGRDYSVLAADAGVARSYVYNGRPVQRFPAILRAEQAAQMAGRGLWRACAPPAPPVPTSVVPTTGKPAPTTKPPSTRKPVPTTRPAGPFANCAAARAAGAAPVRRGTPGYSPRLDGDNDGIGCE